MDTLINLTKLTSNAVLLIEKLAFCLVQYHKIFIFFSEELTRFQPKEVEPI